MMMNRGRWIEWIGLIQTPPLLTIFLFTSSCAKKTAASFKIMVYGFDTILEVVPTTCTKNTVMLLCAKPLNKCVRCHLNLSTIYIYHPNMETNQALSLTNRC